METWILVADEQHAALLVQSSVGSLHEIETWDSSAHSELDFADKIARRVECLQTDFDNLVVAAPPQLLWNLSIAFGDSLNGKVAAGLARDLTSMSCKQLRSELYETFAGGLGGPAQGPPRSTLVEGGTGASPLDLPLLAV